MKKPIVLVHGAWQGDYVWDQVKAGLVADGYRVSVVKLPGHGSDNTPAYQVTFQAYVNEVKNAINEYNEPVILVGHSLGGAIVTQTAAELSQKINKLVYVAGYIPASGKSVLDYSMMDTASPLGPLIRLSDDQTQAAIAEPELNLAKIFSQDATEAQKQFLLNQYKAEPTIPMGTPLTYNREAYNAISNKYYVYTLADNAITCDFQQQMVAAAGISNTFIMNTGHSPFVSQPAELTNILKEISKK